MYDPIKTQIMTMKKGKRLVLTSKDKNVLIEIIDSDYTLPEGVEVFN